MEEVNVLTSEEAVEKVKGNSCYQIMVCLVYSLNSSPIDYFVFGLSFLQDRDDIQVLCYQGDSIGYEVCTPREACANTGGYKFNTEAPFLKNWMTDSPGLLCYS